MPTVDNGCRFGHHFRWRASDFSSIRVAVEINYLRCYFIELNKTPQQRPQPTPADGRPRIRHQIGVILWINAIGWAKALPMTMAPSITKGANDQEDDSDFAASPSPSGAASPHGPPSNSTVTPSHPVNWAHHLTLHHQLYNSMEKLICSQYSARNMNLFSSILWRSQQCRLPPHEGVSANLLKYLSLVANRMGCIRSKKRMQ